MTGLLPEGSENQEVLRITRLPAWSPVVSAELPSSGPKLETGGPGAARPPRRKERGVVVGAPFGS